MYYIELKYISVQNTVIMMLYFGDVTNAIYHQ